MILSLTHATSIAPKMHNTYISGLAEFFRKLHHLNLSFYALLRAWFALLARWLCQISIHSKTTTARSVYPSDPESQKQYEPILSSQCFTVSILFLGSLHSNCCSLKAHKIGKKGFMQYNCYKYFCKWFLGRSRIHCFIMVW